MSKNYKGGYKLISLNGVDVTSMGEGVTIKGIHEAIESSYGKALMLCEIVIDGVEKNDVYVETIVVDSGSFKFTALGYDFTISDEDEVVAVEHEEKPSLSIKTDDVNISVDNEDISYIAEIGVGYAGKHIISVENESGAKFYPTAYDGGLLSFVISAGISQLVTIKKINYIE